MAKARKEIAKQDRWNIEALYANLDAWREDFNTIAASQSPRWPHLAKLQGTLEQNPGQVKKALDQLYEIDRHLSKLYTYAHLRHDEDIAESAPKAAYNEAFSALSDFQQESSWFEPELIALPPEKIKAYLNDPLLQPYRVHLEKIFRMKPHTLSADKEMLMAMSGKALSTAHKAFSAINDADFKFGMVKDSAGNEHELTHGKYSLYLRSPDQTLRKNAFEKYHSKYKDFENTLAELLSGQVETHVFNARARGFKSSLQAALFSKNIDTSVYHALIEAVHEEIGVLHRYLQLRAKALGLKTLHMYDLQVPLVKDGDKKIPYAEAVDLVSESVAPLGPDYQSALIKGLKVDRWVDVYENQNKRSGAYSSGCYDSMPYILMNYKEIIRDAFVLSHEVGHSMHSYFSRKYQPYQYSDYSIFVAEVASTFNEELLLEALLKRVETRDEKIFLLTQKLEDIRGTLFRQTQFAEFELKIHMLAEQNIPLTPQLLNDEYLKLNTFYFGPSMVNDAEIASEWARIPHFYYNFYVYQYATGISAALALAERVKSGGVKERDDYLAFLKSGSSLFPLDALKLAGVDMQSVAPIKQAIRKFDELLDQLEALLSEELNLAVK